MIQKPSRAYGLEVGKLGWYALNGHFQFFADRRLGCERVGGNFLAIFQQGPEMAANRVFRHFARGFETMQKEGNAERKSR